MSQTKTIPRLRARADTSFHRGIAHPFLGRYLPLGRCGSGGMSTVFQARDLDTGCTVAAKLMPRPRNWQRVGREIEALQSIDHPNVVRMLDFGFDGDHGHVVIVMELLHGAPLSTLLERDPRPPWRTALRLGLAVLDGLACIHDRGLVHRDIKPSNLIVADAQRLGIKIIDFGIVKPLDETRRITELETIVGTPAYMPPEQLLGLKVGPDADVYALGQVLLQMLSGQTPRDRGLDDFGVKMRFSPQLPHDGAHVPRAVQTVISAMLHPMPARRPSSALHCAESIRSALVELNDAPVDDSMHEDTVRLVAAR